MVRQIRGFMQPAPRSRADGRAFWIRYRKPIRQIYVYDELEMKLTYRTDDLHGERLNQYYKMEVHVMRNGRDEASRGELFSWDYDLDYGWDYQTGIVDIFFNAQITRAAMGRRYTLLFAMEVSNEWGEVYRLAEAETDLFEVI